ELGLWLESDRLGFFLPALTSEKLETQRSVVMNERRQRVDNQPYGRASERLNELLFPPDHPYHWPVIGYMDDIAAATLEDVREFFLAHYAPGNAVLTLAGSFDPDDALARVERWFGPLSPGPVPEPVAPPPPELTGERRDLLEDDVRLSRLYLAAHAPAYGRPEWYAADLTARILTGGKSSRLHQDLVYRRELARHVMAYVLPTELAAPFCIVATAHPDRSIGALEAAVVEHLERLAGEGPTDEELERARNRVLTDLYDELQTVDARADLLSQCATFFRDPSRAFGEAERYDAVSTSDVQEFARRRLVEAGRAVVTVVPRREAA
ncbi:MAG: M16 family metallopeptidase, partial [Thermoanaerobaculia bacterium]